MTRHGISTTYKVSVICGDHGRAQHLCNILNSENLNARSGDFTEICDAILFDLKTCRPSLVEEISKYTEKCVGSKPLIVTLGDFLCGSEIPSSVDIRLSSDSALVLAQARIHFAKRKAARRAEVELRRQSYRKFGFDAPPESKHQNKDVLYVGDASTRYLALKAHLETSGFNLTASFSAYTAFDYLHEHSFGAVLVDATSETIRSDNFCAMVRRSPNLTDLPLLALIDDSFVMDEDTLNCAIDLVEKDTPLSSVSFQLTELMTKRGPSAKDFEAPTPDVTDVATGLFSKAFFENHFEHQVEWSLNYNQPLTLLIVRVLGETDKSADPRDLAYTAKVLRTLLRIQDAPTRVDGSTLAISMPGADEKAAINAAHRIEGVLDATAFESEPGKPSRQVVIQWRIAELNPDQSHEQLLSKALDGGPFKSGHVAA